VTTDDGAVNTTFGLVDVQWIGAGRLDAGAAVNASVLASPTSLSFGILTAAPSNLSKQITLTNTGFRCRHAHRRRGGRRQEPYR